MRHIIKPLLRHCMMPMLVVLQVDLPPLGRTNRS